MKAFLFIIAIISNEGELQMKAKEMDYCPDQAGFSTVMEKMKSDGKFIQWNAICYDMRKGTEL
jgi:hypothetical protein